mgnify:FL=1
MIVSDGAGERVRPDLVLGLLVESRKSFFFKPKVVYAANFSKGVLEKFNEWGIKIYESKVGRPHIRKLMIERRADYGGELSGHLLFKDNNYCELPLAAMLTILKIMARSASLGQAKNINQLLEEFKTWFNSGEINIAAGNWPIATSELFGKLKERYRDGKVDELDGLTVEYNDPANSGASWWFNLRPSNTEPVMRLVVEAKTKNLLDEKIGEIMGAMMLK